MVAFNQGFEPPISEFNISSSEMLVLYKSLSFTLITQLSFAEADDRENMIEAMHPYLELREKIKSELIKTGTELNENENIH